MSADQQTADAFATSWNHLPEGSIYTKAQFDDWLYRPKQGFAVPVARWFREGTLLPGGAKAVDGLAPGFVARMLAEHHAGRANQHAFLWNYWALQAAARRPR